LQSHTQATRAHARTHSLTHSLTHARTHSLTHSLTHRVNTRHNPHEDALITLHTSRCAEKLRTIFAESGWDATLAPWLNGTLLDSLDQELLEEYIDMLRHLRLKCPRIMDARGLLDGKGSRRLAGSSALRSAVATPPEMNPGMEAVEWEFTVAPVLVLAPCEHSWSSVHLSGWKKRLAALGKVVSCQEVGLQFCSPSSSSVQTNMRVNIRIHFIPTHAHFTHAHLTLTHALAHLRVTALR
jgi:hypothetical protein